MHENSESDKNESAARRRKIVRRQVKGGERSYTYNYSTLHVCLPKSLLARLKDRAGADGVTQSSLARKIIHRALYA